MNTRTVLTVMSLLLIGGLTACGVPNSALTVTNSGKVTNQPGSDDNQDNNNGNPSDGTNSKKEDLVITTLSNRADLISGGDALIRIALPEGVDSKSLSVMVGNRDVTKAFIQNATGQVTGLVDGLVVGDNNLEAHLADGRGARIKIINHPKGGPVFAGPQVQPWTCTTLENGLGMPADDQCNVTTKITYVYQPTGNNPSGGYKDYDPANPPADVSMTTTDEGKTVPYIVRVEQGTLDRSIYKIMVLADPAKPWTATSPQSSWNRKLFVAFGGGCGTLHMQTPPTQAGLAFPFGPLEYAFGDSAADGEIQQPELLARGWMATGSGLNTFNQNCNDVVSAEAVMMIKEHVIEAYGPIKRTVSVGGSGGSIQQHNIAASYPGLLDGIAPSQSFPDLWNMVWDASECHLLTRYFLTISPQLWNDPNQQLAVLGKGGPVSCGEFMAMFADAMDPQNRGIMHVGAAIRFGCLLPPTQTYRPIINPTGTRCSVQDYQNAIWGHGGPLDAAPLPYDNSGVQYGLVPLQNGVITPEQFVDLNEKVGGLDNEGEFTAKRSSMDIATARTMYRASRTTDANQLSKVPIIDIRSVTNASYPELLTDMHQPFYSFVMRARLDAANGTHANQIFRRFVPSSMDISSALDLDRWLQAVEKDTSNLSREQKIIRNKPEDLVDTCWIDGNPVTDEARCEQQYPINGDARTAAGESLEDNIRKCQLKPLKKDDYKITFTDAQWSRLKAVFPSGVCDWSKPSLGYETSIPWMTYSKGPGGTPLGLAPVSTPMN